MSDEPEIRLGDVLAALTYALDLAEGQVAGHSLRTCLIGMTLAERMGLDPQRRSELYYALLLKDAGCSSNAARVAALLNADDQDVKGAFKVFDWTRRAGRFRFAARVVARGEPLPERVRNLLELARGQDVNRTIIRLRCERGAQIADGLGFPPATAEGIYSLDEHWDGSGHPHGARGEEIPLLARILGLSQTVEVFTTSRGARAGLRVARRRKGRWFDPSLVPLLDADMLRALPSEPAELSAAVAAHEPPDRVLVADEARVSRVAHAFAEVIDAKSPSTAGHSHRVADLALATAERLGARPDRDLLRAALLHDIGKLAVSNRILDKPGPLDAREWAAIRAHPLHAEQLLGRVDALRHVAAMAGAHHERLDGSGYPYGLQGEDIPLATRLLAVADTYEAMTAARPYRSAVSSERAVEELRREARAGRLDADCVEALAALVVDPRLEPARRRSH